MKAQTNIKTKWHAFQHKNHHGKVGRVTLEGSKYKAYYKGRPVGRYKSLGDAAAALREWHGEKLWFLLDSPATSFTA